MRLDNDWEITEPYPKAQDEGFVKVHSYSEASAILEPNKHDPVLMNHLAGLLHDSDHGVARQDPDEIVNGLVAMMCNGKLLVRQHKRPVLLSPAVEHTATVTFGITAPLTWDAYWRGAYDKANEALQKQAAFLLKRGNITIEEANALVEGRNRLVLEMRKPLSPFGKAYSEIVKPRASLKTLEQFLEEKGSVEAVLRSVGKARQTVSRFNMVARVAGPALIALDITVTTVVIAKAPPDQRGRVASREIGSLAGSMAGSAGGGWAGCISAVAIFSPSLTLPIVGEVTEGTVCVGGWLLGGAGGAWVGKSIGETAGQTSYDFFWKENK